MKKLKIFVDGKGKYLLKARYMIFFWCDVEIFSNGEISYHDDSFCPSYITRFDSLVDALKAIQDYYDYKAPHIPIDGIESLEHAKCIDELNKENKKTESLI